MVHLCTLMFLHAPNIPLTRPLISAVKRVMLLKDGLFLTHFLFLSFLVIPKHGNFSVSLTLCIYLQSASTNDNPPDTVPAVFSSEVDSLKRAWMISASTFKIHKPGRFSGIMDERVL